MTSFFYHTSLLFTFFFHFNVQKLFFLYFLGAAPSVGGMITTANAQRKKAGKARLGFLNPLMYTRPSILNEITHGWNNCTAIRTTCCPMGFTSASGKN